MTTPFRFGPGRCCCPDCWAWSDDFTRVPPFDTTDLGSGWHEEVGDWGIVSLKLRETYGASGGTANAKVFGTNPSPSTNPGEQSIHVTVADPQAGDVFFIYPCCTDSSTAGPVVCKYTYLGSQDPGVADWTTEINGGYLISQVGSNVSTNPWLEFVLIACADHASKFVKAAVGSVGDEFSWANDLDPGTGRYYSLGHNNTTNGATFDNFSITNLRGADGEVCADCWCMCDQEAVDRHVTATMVADTAGTNRAACLNGVSWAMDWIWRDPKGQWEGSVTITRDGHTHVMPFILYCEPWEVGDYSGENWWLQWTSPVSVCNDGQVLLRANNTSTCDPLRLVFGPYHLSRTGNLACYLCYDPFPAAGPEDGYFTIEITD